MKHFYTICLLLFLGFGNHARAQVFNSGDPVITYNPNNPPATPAWGTIGKWVRTLRTAVNFTNKDSYKCYYLNGMPFRLKFPKTYQQGVNDGKTYPIFIFFHGKGESGTVYDNEYSLYHGGGKFCANVDNGNFDGFILVPQSTNGFFGAPHFAFIKTILDTLIRSNKLDENRIFDNGLSGGGTSTWEFMFAYPKMVAGFLPISGCSVAYKDQVNTFKYIPMWIFQGGLDNNPHPNTTEQVMNAALAAGANVKETLFPTGGHGIWNNSWDLPDFWPFINRQHKANPWPKFGHYEFCPGEEVNATLGLTAGFDGYEWRKDGVTIAGATTNELVVTTFGTYDARIKRGTVWSPWSPSPVVVKLKAPTQTPPISISGLMSKVIPATDGKTFVTLSLPTGYTSYIWQKVGDTTTLGTGQTLNVTTAGQYQAKVTEQFGCSSAFSAPFLVTAANGTNAPSPAVGLAATAISKIAITLDWTDNPNATYNETGYEVYRSATAGGPYELINITAANAVTYTDTDLNPNTKYFYVVRAVNNTSAAPLSIEVNAQTQVDATPPTAPANLTVTGTQATAISLEWDPSTDDVGVYKYDIYVNGIKSYTVDNNTTEFTVYGLKNDSIYTLVVKARDIAGNSSARSNQVSAGAYINGLAYRYYTGTWTTLPDFNALTPDATGYSATPDISVRTQDDYFGFVWEGSIRIPVTGNYTFMTNSDAGSKLWIDTKYNATATPVVNNDGIHNTRDREGTRFLTAGMHQIAIAYFEGTGSQGMTVMWKNTANGIGSKQTIAADYYKEIVPASPGVPKAPGNLLATALTYSKIRLTWADSSNNETNFEIYRATAAAGPYTSIATVPANTTAYTDSNLVAQTAYYYRLKAINKYGNSGLNLNESGGFLYGIYPGNYSSLPNFSALTPIKTGVVGNITLDIRDRETNYALKFSGYINIPTTGSYTFYTASDDGSKLYIGGSAETNLVVNNNFVQGTTERSGIKILTQGRYPIFITYFQQGGGQTLSASYAGPGISKRLMADSVFGNPKMTATTLPMPATPNGPTALALTALSSSRIKLEWNDNSTTETQFEVYRAVNDSSSFKLYATIGANSTAQATFADSSLFANVTYYYKVRAKNEGGYSVFTNGAGISTLNNSPVITQLVNRSVRYGTQLVLNLTITDPDVETITLTAANVPSFGAFSDNGNGTATLTFNPSTTDQGTYPNVTVTATDQHSGVATTSFTLTVNDNYTPAIAPVANVSLNENTTSAINLSATDDNAETVTWTATGLPSFATFVPSGNSGVINLAPGYIDAGTYNVTLQANDGRDGIDTKTFTITVVDVDPSRSIYVNFSDGSYPPAAPWNSTNKQPVLNDLFPNLKDQSNIATSIGIQIVSNWSAIGNGSNYFGVSTGNNSGVYPDNVMKTAYWSNTTKQTFKLYGLNSTSKYSFTFFGSRADVTDNRMTNYTIGGTTVSLQAASNRTNTVSINNVSPNVNNEISIDLQNGTGSVYSYLNAMVVKVSYDDGNAPARPTNLAVQSATSGVGLTWKDIAFNESAYEIYRAPVAEGPYTLLNPVTAANAVAYTDTSAKANKQYFYAIRAINSNGASAYSDTVSITTGNNNPKLDSIAGVTIKNNESVTINLHATDDAGDILTIKATNLPSFASLVDNGDGTGTITITPAAGNVGKYNSINVTVNDNNGGSTTRTFNLYVRDKNLTSVYVHFNMTLPADAPWNNFNSYPGATASISNLQDETGTATPFRIQLLDAFTGTNTSGATTGNNSGVYPDNAIAGNYYTSESTARRIRISGLSATYRYNLIFFGSRIGSDNKNTEYTVGTNTVTLNAANNSLNTVQINGIEADASGVIDFTVKQATGALYGYINDVVIQYYIDNGTPLNPTTAIANPTSKTSIQLKWMDNSNNETGFEVWRSTDNSTFSLLSTLGNNANTYTDGGLATDARYYYKVRALKDTAKSDFTNVASASTFISAVYINCNVFDPAGVPWNNTNSAPAAGIEFPDLKDDNGNNTGLTMVIAKAFTGDNPFGMNTGNNSGIYPDNVMRSTYWMDINEEGQLLIKGLNLAKRYNFVFFASRDGSGDRTSNYTINTTTVSLNAGYNTSQTVQINDLAPDANGEVLIKVTAGGASIFGYIGALVIQSYTPESSQLDPSLVMAKSAGSLMNGQLLNTGATSNVTLTRVYPNPFDGQITLDLSNNGKASSKFTVSILDMNGRTLYTRQLSGISGSQRVSLDLSGEQIPTGPCLLRVMDGDKVIKTVKLIKN
ncbi:Fibronectin type III domain-containing protein [Chitinophaga sp. CF118]|uniref:fibronectin type III domain-containing protein n=1 Tax=Chitinophaga sp. CF118 TaxID=1884367 RepID=UPI0008EA6542|nr:fibronectin type III domain-containing protein [Chitinophaga sp. CF118]SFE92970.1 Fibronectin type III domain-containing protein [Chitinophaga sp. CF118]